MGKDALGGSKSKPLMLKGQGALGEMLFGKNGPFAALFGGGPDTGFEIGANRSRANLNANLSQQGLLNTPLAAKAQTDFESQVASGRESSRLETLLGAIQPLGSQSSSGPGWLSALGGHFSK